MSFAINDLPIPLAEDPTFCGGQAQAPYRPSDYGGLSRADWSVPTGILWEDQNISLQFDDPDTPAICYALPYLFFRKDTGGCFLSIQSGSVFSLWSDMRKALDLPYLKNFSDEDVGFSVTANDGRIQLRLKIVHYRGDTFVPKKAGIEISKDAAASLTKALDMAADHASRHYCRLFFRDRLNRFGKKAIAEVKNDAPSGSFALIKSVIQ